MAEEPLAQGAQFRSLHGALHRSSDFSLAYTWWHQLEIPGGKT